MGAPGRPGAGAGPLGPGAGAGPLGPGAGAGPLGPGAGAASPHFMGFRPRFLVTTRFLVTRTTCGVAGVTKNPDVTKKSTETRPGRGAPGSPVG